MRRIIPILFILLSLSACSSIDCPIKNTVYTVYNLYKSNGSVDTLADTITIYAQRMNGSDTILINKDVKIKTFSLPVSYTLPEDILFFNITDTAGNSKKDTLWIAKENTPHFESVDCSPNYFHTLTGIKYTRHAIDSVVIFNNNVTYDASKEHFHIYFKNND